MKRILLLAFTSCMLLAALNGCGGGDDDSSTPTPTPAPSTSTVTGSVYAAPVNGASVVVKDVNGNIVAGPVTTAADGTYAINIPTSALSGDLRIEATGGTFTDEATGAPGIMAGRLTAYTAGGTLGAGSAVHLDPSSTIVHDLVITGLFPIVADAKTRFSGVFGYSPNTSIAPQDPDSPLTGDSNAPRRLAGLRAAAFSRIANDLGLTPEEQFDLIKAMAKDLSDGAAADGLYNGAAIEIVPGNNLPANWKTQFETAMTAMANVRLTNSYRVTYLPGMGMMAPKEGKSQFQIRVEKHDNTPAAGLALKIKPMMHMNDGKNHSTPVDIVSESSTTPGTYDCTAYYLMASGPTMGFWDMKVDITDGITTESTMFFPPVGMVMGAKPRATLKGVNDLIVGTPPEKRSYFLFNDGLMSGMGGNYTFKLFMATKESMMSYPAVGIGTTLNNEQTPPTPWVVNSITLEASTDNATWFPAIEGAVKGHWSIANLPGLVIGVPATIYVRLTVNGEVKTDNAGLAYATFTVTPM
ncbi:MAG: hypothetical protein A2511_11970 [Deltaproteobacteria bacterium RIFOXYD12_FULL_50_9]|nr:MAG: hypothetical protein A2511_11970 [Deltaproteobacteria bacterium RIFOXYD12_FULL_50_9]